MLGCHPSDPGFKSRPGRHLKSLKGARAHELSDTSTIPVGVLRRIQLRAISLANNEIIRIKTFQMSPEKHLFLDIETTLGGGMVWLIGLMTEDGFTQLYADKQEQEKDIFVEFLKALRRLRGYAAVTWSRFDTRVLQSRMKLHGLRCEQLSSMVHIDLRRRVLNSFIFPTRGCGLKRIGSFIGYPFRNPRLNGLKVALAYERHVLSGAPLHPGIFRYNEDDVRVLPYIIKWAAKYEPRI